jgi:hypothetical protein
MDRPTWALIIGVLGIAILALGAATLSRNGQAPPDLTTPEGVVTAYILAVQNKEPDKAWELLASPVALTGPFPGSGGRVDTLTQENFRQQVLNSQRSGNRRLRILNTTVTESTARVDVETTYVNDDPFQFGSRGTPQTRAFELKRADAGWRITAAPQLFELV